MTFVSMKNMLTQAKRDHYAVAQININGLLWIQAILASAQRPAPASPDYCLGV